VHGTHALAFWFPVRALNVPGAHAVGAATLAEQNAPAVQMTAFGVDEPVGQ
jgi:hypothetical protein